jgi:hypothetical protein
MIVRSDDDDDDDDDDNLELYQQYIPPNAFTLRSFMRALPNTIQKNLDFVCPKPCTSLMQSKI